MQGRFTVCVRAAVLSAGLCASALAQQGESPLDKATAPNTDKPIAAVPTPVDPDAHRVLTMLAGSFESRAKGDQPALVLNSAPVNVSGLPGAVYFEIARADAPADPFRSGLFWVYRRKDGMHLRVLDLAGAGTGGLADALAGVCHAPDAFPTLEMSAFQTNVDMAIKEASGGFAGATDCAAPTMRDGAVEMTSAATISANSVSFADQGFDEHGTRVWGTTDAKGIEFTRITKPAGTVTRDPEGLIVITTVPPAAGAAKLVEGGEIVVQYTGWLASGTKFDSSRQAGREPFKIRIPGGVIKGWNEGLKGIAKGERRRLIIPPAMAYGERGAGRGLIPPNSTLIFDVECLWVDNSNPTPTPPPQPPPSGATGGQAGSEGSVGKPAKNSAPEKPR